MKYDVSQQIGDYILKDYIGSGAAGHVYRVEHVLTGRVEAMKILCPDTPSAHSAERFLREAKLQARLSHPNIAAVYNSFWAGPDLAIVMEFIDGESLRQILDRGAIPFPQAASYALQILKALAYAHDKNVVHRDVSPSNILVRGDGRIKLTDFGLAKEPGALGATHNGSLLGSLHYISPEQIRSADSAGRASDVYSAAAVLYEVFTGRKVFDSDNAFELMKAQTEAPPVPPTRWNPVLAPPIEAALLKALEKDPARRFSDGRQFLDAIEDCVVSVLVGPSFFERWRIPMAAAAGLLVCAFGLVAYRAERTGPPPAAQTNAVTVPAQPEPGVQPIAEPAAESPAPVPRKATPAPTVNAPIRKQPAVFAPRPGTPVKDPALDQALLLDSAPALAPRPIELGGAPVEPTDGLPEGAITPPKKPKGGFLRSVGRRINIFRRRNP
jgi:serine/threonine-protein kinase